MSETGDSFLDAVNNPSSQDPSKDRESGRPETTEGNLKSGTAKRNGARSNLAAGEMDVEPEGLCEASSHSPGDGFSSDSLKEASLDSESIESESIESESIQSRAFESASLEAVIRQLELDFPSAECDENVMALIRGSSAGSDRGFSNSQSGAGRFEGNEVSIGAHPDGGEDIVRSDIVRSDIVRSDIVRSDVALHESARGGKRNRGEYPNGAAGLEQPLSTGWIPSAGMLTGMCLSLFVGFLMGAFWFAGGAGFQVQPDDPGNADRIAGKEDSIAHHLLDNVRLVAGSSETVIVDESLQWRNQTAIRRVETLTHKTIRVRDEEGEQETEMQVPVRKVIYTLAEEI